MISRFLYILLLLPSLLLAKGIGVPAIVVRDSAVSVADTLKIFPDSIVFKAGAVRNTYVRQYKIKADSILGHLYGTADSLGGNPWTAYLRSDVADTAAMHGNLYLGGHIPYNYGGSAFFDSLGDFNVGVGFVVGPTGANVRQNIIPPANSYRNIITTNGLSGGGTVPRWSVRDAIHDTAYHFDLYSGWGEGQQYIYSSYPIWIKGTKIGADAYDRVKFPFAVYDSLDAMVVGICDTMPLSPIVVGTETNTYAKFGIRCSTRHLQADTLVANAQLRVQGSDTLTVFHRGDTTHFQTTAKVFTFNKPVLADTFQTSDTTKAFYLGPPSIDGSWRIVGSGNNLCHQRREGGNWVTKQTITP